MTFKFKAFLYTFVISVLMNYNVSYIEKSQTPGTDFFSPAQAHAIAIDYKVCPSCQIYFTQRVRDDLISNGLDIKTIQYYTSSEIILYRLVKKDRHQASTGGVVKYRSGKLVEEIKIRKFTPGVCIRHNKDTLYMLFGKDKKFSLPFKNQRGYYKLFNDEGSVYVNKIKFQLLKGRTSILIIEKHVTKTGKSRKKILNGQVIKNK